MFAAAALLSLLASLTFAGWVADRWARAADDGGLSRWERVGLVGAWATLLTLTVGLAERSRIDSEYLWIHWLILAAVIVTAVGFIGAYVTRRR